MSAGRGVSRCWTYVGLSISRILHQLKAGENHVHTDVVQRELLRFTVSSPCRFKRPDLNEWLEGQRATSCYTDEDPK